MLSDLPPDVQTLPNAQAGVGDAHFEQVGDASWYGTEHAGRRTSSGTRFDPYGLTAAHAWLPLGSRIRVIREDTGSSVVVTITDRIGTDRRIVDLSLGAAEKLGMRSIGVTQVRLVEAEGGVFIPVPVQAPRPAPQAAAKPAAHPAAETPAVAQMVVHARAVRSANSAPPPAAPQRL